jgi:hypothetical protein
VPVDATEEMKDARQAIDIRMDRGACSTHHGARCGLRIAPRQKWVINLAKYVWAVESATAVRYFRG